VTYVDLDIASDAETLLQDFLDALADDGWTPQATDLIYRIGQAFTLAAQNAAEVAASMPAAVFRTLGTELFGVAYQAATPAEADVVFTLADTDGHTIPADTSVQIGDAYFATVEDVDVAAGSNTATVLVRALDTGAASNGYIDPVELVNPLAWVDSLAVLAPTSGGTDEEADDVYQSRLADDLALMTPRPITDADFGILARSTPGVVVGRATAQTTGPRTVDVTVTDVDGAALGSVDKTTVATYLDGLREVNFVVNVVDATYNAVTISYSVAVTPDFVADTVTSGIESALTALFNPATWGVPATSPDPANNWLNSPTIRYSRVLGTIQAVEGVAYVESLLIGLSSPTVVAPTAGDVTMTGVAPLPTLDTADITPTIL
jgi:Baseplate J-like protein